jgi:hypothetical protein
MALTCWRGATGLFRVAVWGIVLAGTARGVELPEVAPLPGTPPPELGQPDFPRTYGPLDAGRDAYERSERRRREQIDRQLQLQEDLVWWHSWPGSYRYPPSQESIYAYPPSEPLPPRRVLKEPPRAYRSPTYGGYSHVFEPWPFVPGDIWGYPWIDRVEQPLGHKIIETGPNSYIYRPVYPSDLKPKEPAEASPQEPAVEGPPPEPVPPPAERGPRVF